MQKNLLTVKELAAELGMTPKSIHDMKWVQEPVTLEQRCQLSVPLSPREITPEFNELPVDGINCLHQRPWITGAHKVWSIWSKTYWRGLPGGDHEEGCA